ncbi:penicillin-binding protein 2 [Alteromonadaceae bacterium M269]|nr:penicillin-binding protein 2 [Alteromonadaceae bacterium M269]
MVFKRISIRDHTAEANLFARRTLIALLVIATMIFILLSNLYYLQIERHEVYQTRSNGNRIKVLPVAPNRGLIYDRNGVVLAENRPVYSLQVIPEETDNLDNTLEELVTLLDITEEEVADFRKEFKSTRRFKPVTLRNQLNEQEVALFSANQHKFNGVSVEARLTRHYPYADSLTHMLGYVAKINKRDLQKLTEASLEDNYAATYDIGKLGIEKYHESLLHGQVGYQEVEVNSQGRVIRTLSFTPPVPGQDLVLNIDVNLQMIAQQALDGRRGAVVVMDSRDGGILSLYSNPSYDPNLFVNGISGKDYSALLQSKDRPLINRATQGQYPPASTIKPHMALLALDEEIIKPDSTIRDYGSFQLRNSSHKWRDWRPYGHRNKDDKNIINVTDAIEQSCDVFFYDAAYKLGIDRISDKMFEFGFGDYTGIDLYEESAAIMPSRGWKRANKNLPWYPGDTVIIGIGQSYWTTTPLQLAQSVATIANKGIRRVPQIIRGNMIEGRQLVFEPKELRPVEVKNPEHWDVVLDAMYGVVNREKGTALNVFKDANYISAGKTGTAQLFQIAQDEKYDKENVADRLRDNAMYVGYAPYDNPELVIAVALENAGSGAATPVARQVMDYYFRDKPTLIAQDKESTNLAAR